MSQRWNGYALAELVPAGQEDTAPEIALWAAVLVQSIRDACQGGLTATGAPLRARALRNRDEARAWLLGAGYGFRLVCTGAGYDPARVRPAMVRLAAAGWPDDFLKDGRLANGFANR